MSGVITGSEGRKEKLSEAVFGTMRSRQGTYYHVVTSPRHDVGSTMQKSTTSPRRDVTTSLRQLENLHLIIKCQTARKLGHREAYDQRHGFPEPEDPDFGRVPGICTAFQFLLDIIENMMMMFLRLDTLFFSFMMF